jgi:hypothetical protein
MFVQSGIAETTLIRENEPRIPSNVPMPEWGIPLYECRVMTGGYLEITRALKRRNFTTLSFLEWRPG